MKELKGHTGPVGSVKFNPKYTMFASSCYALAFWIPTQQKKTSTF